MTDGAVAGHGVGRLATSTARQRYQLATVRYGAHRRPYFANAFGEGIARFR